MRLLGIPHHASAFVNFRQWLANIGKLSPSPHLHVPAGIPRSVLQNLKTTVVHTTLYYLRVLRKKFRITLNTSLVRNPDLM